MPERYGVRLPIRKRTARGQMGRRILGTCTETALATQVCRPLTGLNRLDSSACCPPWTVAPCPVARGDHSGANARPGHGGRGGSGGSNPRHGSGLWGAREATVELDGDFAYRFGTPAGPLGMAWEMRRGRVRAAGGRNATATGDMALAVVCFNGCAPCEGCADPFSANYDPLADPNRLHLCETEGMTGCTTRQRPTTVVLQWDDGSSSPIRGRLSGPQW